MTLINSEDPLVGGTIITPSDGSMALHSEPDTLYTHPFKVGEPAEGKIFNIVTMDDKQIPNEVELPLSTRVKLSFTFIKNKNDLSQITIKKFRYKDSIWQEELTECVKLSPITFQKINSFIKFLSEHDLNVINERKLKLSDEMEKLDPETVKMIKTFLLKKDGPIIIEELLRNGAVTSKDIVNLGFRKSQLQVFKNLLETEGFIETYKSENQIQGDGPEKGWQHFFAQNEWIFGYGLDYRFLSILQKESHTGIDNLAGGGSAIADFLLGCKDFTVIVELKRPDTDLFKESKRANRASAWSLSPELITSVSQILEQKAEWLVKGRINTNSNFTSDGKLISQKTVDPKALLIIGHRKQYEGSTQETQVKAQTFELFRRDSRNIEIVTYDELYERASFIVEHNQDKEEA